MSLEQKVILITGAASGIGRAAALAVAEAGGSVAISDINVTGGEETAQLVTDAGGDAFLMRVDVTAQSMPRLRTRNTRSGPEPKYKCRVSLEWRAFNCSSIGTNHEIPIS